MSSYLKKLIESGENQNLDFKFEISDSRKIAKTISAFANTNGGKLLLGVKDNGRIAGVRSEEEYYMMEAAADLYCKPSVKFELNKWSVDGKTVLEIIIPEIKEKPCLAQNNEGNWLAYIRKNDQNILAGRVHLKVWKKQNRDKGILIKYTQKEKILFDFLEKNNFITVNKYCKIAALKPFIAEQKISDMILLNILEMEVTEKCTIFRFKNNLRPEIDNRFQV